MIVVDLGCHTHGDQDSIRKLIRRYEPEILFGFDPHPETVEGIERVDGSVVVIARRAASTVDGVGYLHLDGTATRLARDGLPTHTFDLAAWLLTLPRVLIVLKLDVEGAEYDLLPHLHDRLADELLERLLVEWHGDPLDINFACPVEEWHD